jgi:hypothetical protein
VSIEKLMLIANFSHLIDLIMYEALKLAFVYVNFVGITMDGTKDMNYASILIIQRFKKFLCNRRCQLFLDWRCSGSLGSVLNIILIFRTIFFHPARPVMCL